MADNGNIISNEDLELVLNKLAQLEHQPLEKYQKNLKALSYITHLFRKQNLKPVIVGGHAVELYTAGHYTTMDVDLVLSGRHHAASLLEMTGFQKDPPHSKHWYHEQLNIPLEIPDEVLDGSMDKIIEVAIEDDFVVYVIGIEDLLIDRIRAAVHWESQSDREWALFLMNAQWKEIDFVYLEQRAKKDRKEHKLFLELVQEIQHFHTQE